MSGLGGDITELRKRIHSLEKLFHQLTKEIAGGFIILGGKIEELEDRLQNLENFLNSVRGDKDECDCHPMDSCPHIKGTN